MAGLPEELRVYLTGGVRVERGASLIRQRSFSFPYAAIAFAYFVCERGRPVPGGDLACLVLPDAPPLGAETLIQATTHKLRRALARQAHGFNLRVSGRSCTSST